MDDSQIASCFFARTRPKQYATPYYWCITSLNDCEFGSISKTEHSTENQKRVGACRYDSDPNSRKMSTYHSLTLCANIRKTAKSGYIKLEKTFWNLLFFGCAMWVDATYILSRELPFPEK